MASDIKIPEADKIKEKIMQVDEAAPSNKVLLVQAEDSILVVALVRYLPAVHDEQFDEAAPLYCPALQSVQAEDSTPVAELVRYLPAVHDEQVDEAAPLYCPALQSEQTEDSSPVAPLLMFFPAGQLPLE